MAIFHLHVRNISRGDGRSVVAAAAYRAGETLPNEAEERLSAFGGRRDVLHAEIMLPAGAPAWMTDRARLWNAVEAAERRKDARLAKEIEVALPRELARPAWLELARALADAYTYQGFVADLAIHDDGTAHNPHVHILLTTRAIDGDGFGLKVRDADSVKFVNEARALWAALANAALAAAGESAAIDPRSHAAAGVRETPGRHAGPDKAARRQKRSAMDNDRLEKARADLLNMNPRVAHPFPHLAARPDWPPTSRDMPEGLSQIEQYEFTAFWEAVDARQAMMARRASGASSQAIDDTYPVPGPHGELIAPSEQARAEDAMLRTVEGPAQTYENAIYPAGEMSAPRADGDRRDHDPALPGQPRSRRWDNLESRSEDRPTVRAGAQQPRARRWSGQENQSDDRRETLADMQKPRARRWAEGQIHQEVDKTPERDFPNREDDRDFPPKR